MAFIGLRFCADCSRQMSLQYFASFVQIAPCRSIGKFTAIKTNLNVIYVTKTYLHKKFIYNLFKLLLNFYGSVVYRQQTQMTFLQTKCDFYEY